MKEESEESEKGYAHSIARKCREYMYIYIYIHMYVLKFEPDVLISISNAVFFPETLY